MLPAGGRCSSGVGPMRSAVVVVVVPSRFYREENERLDNVSDLAQLVRGRARFRLLSL